MIFNNHSPSISLVEPDSKSVLYKNPLHLQTVYELIANSLNIDMQLYDLNIDSDRTLFFNTKHNLIIVSTPHNAINSLKSIVAYCEKCLAIILIGEIVTDGLGDEIIGDLEKKMISIPMYKDKSIINILSRYLEKGSKNKYNFLNNSFSNTIIEEYNQRGMQLFLNALSKGCEEKCTFCHLNNNIESSGVVTTIDYKKTVSKMLSLEKKVSKTLFVQFADENFFGGDTDNEKRLRLENIINFSKLICNYESLSSIKIGIDTRVDTVINRHDSIKIKNLRDSAWKNLSSSGLTYIYIGLESISPTQSKRYGKKMNKESVLNSIKYLHELGIDYTLGLILFEPLVTISEIQENINFIRQYSLYKYVASPLKELRIQVKSPYFKLLQNKYPQDFQVNNYLYLNQENVLYKDAHIQKIIPIIRYVSLLFRKSGYRHSDLSRTYKLINKESILFDIPAIIIKLEIRVLEILLESNTNNKKLLQAVINEIYTTIIYILNELYKIKDFDKNITIINYYLSVFKSLKVKLIEHF